MDDLLQLLRSTLQLKQPLEANTPLISSGIIDSFQVVVLLSALESRYGVSIPPESVDAETFDTPAQILASVNRLKE